MSYLSNVRQSTRRYDSGCAVVAALLSWADQTRFEPRRVLRRLVWVEFQHHYRVHYNTRHTFFKGWHATDEPSGISRSAITHPCSTDHQARRL
jgi:hypothetical protein